MSRLQLWSNFDWIPFRAPLTAQSELNSSCNISLYKFRLLPKSLQIIQDGTKKWKLHALGYTWDVPFFLHHHVKTSLQQSHNIY